VLDDLAAHPLAPDLGLAALVVVQEREHLSNDFAEISLAVILLTVIMWLAGWVTGHVCTLEARDRFTLAMVFVVRNVGVATAVAVTVLGRVEFAVFAAASFLAQVPLVLAALALFRLSRVAAPGAP
jgi:ACR3 family arsenite efflux pump ArsB